MRHCAVAVRCLWSVSSEATDEPALDRRLSAPQPRHEMIDHAILAIVGNDVALAQSALWDDRERLREAFGRQPVAWGLGSVQDRRAIIKRRPAGRELGFDFAALASDTPSRVVVGVVAHPDEARLPTDALPPFRFQNWVVACPPIPRGALDDETRTGVDALLDDHVRRTMEGQSDGELLAHALINAVARRPDSRRPGFRLDDAMTAAVEGRATVREVVDDAVPLDAVFSNGRCLVAMTDTRPLYWRWFEGLEDDPVAREERRRMHLAPRPAPRPHYRGLIVTSVDSEPEVAWTRLEPRSVLGFEANSAPEVRAIT